jgi:hypothetical protein
MARNSHIPDWLQHGGPWHMPRFSDNGQTMHCGLFVPALRAFKEIHGQLPKGNVACEKCMKSAESRLNKIVKSVAAVRRLGGKGKRR